MEDRRHLEGWRKTWEGDSVQILASQNDRHT